MALPTYDALIFDFDGTLVDSDEALVDAFVTLGVAREGITFGHAIGEELDRLDLSLDDYADAYDEEVVVPFPGVEAVIAELPRWAMCSNKHPRSGRAELARLGWRPEVVLFADAFDWAHKRLEPVLEQLGLNASQVAMVGDSQGDLDCADGVGCDMYWAGWNPRVTSTAPSKGTVLAHPSDLLELFS